MPNLCFVKFTPVGEAFEREQAGAPALQAYSLAVEAAGGAKDFAELKPLSAFFWLLSPNRQLIVNGWCSALLTRLSAADKGHEKHGAGPAASSGEASSSSKAKRAKTVEADLEDLFGG